MRHSSTDYSTLYMLSTALIWFCYVVYNSRLFSGFVNCTFWSIIVVITECAHRTSVGVRECHTWIGLIKSKSFIWKHHLHSWTTVALNLCELNTTWQNPWFQLSDTLTQFYKMRVGYFYGAQVDQIDFQSILKVTLPNCMCCAINCNQQYKQTIIIILHVPFGMKYCYGNLFHHFIVIYNT
jgi:hypothetical protein